MRHILISGSSTGIGKACAIYLAQKGISVIAGVRRAEDGQALESLAGSNLRSIQLDVSDAGSIADAVKKIEELTGESGLAGIVNNAGIGVLGPVEFVSIDNWRRQFEVNVFGHIAVTQAMLPMLRRHVAREGKGAARIVFIGSIAGRLSTPILGPYCASKHAIAAVAGALRLELREQGIHVSLIEPGAIQSEIWRKADKVASLIIPKHPRARDIYGRLMDAMIRESHISAAGAIPADRVARIVERCLTNSRPPVRIVVGRNAKVAALLRRILPEKWFDAVLIYALNIQ